MLIQAGKDRRADSAAPFPGKSRILDEIANGPKRRRVGLEITGSPAREGTKIFDAAGEKEIGTSPSSPRPVSDVALIRE